MGIMDTLGGLGGAVGGMFTGGLGPLLGGLGGIFGGMTNSREFLQAQSDINDFTSFQGQNAGLGFGNASVGAGGQNSFNFSPEQQLLQQMLQGGSAGQMAGGLFNDQNFQNAFQNNDIQGAFQGAQGALQQQMGNNAFGGLQGLFNQNQGLSNMFAQSLAGGPQDQSGGLMGQQFGMGMANQNAAMDQSALFNQSLDTQRQAATNGGLMDMAINKFQDRAHSTGRAGFSAGQEDQRTFLNNIADQDLGFQNNAFGQAQQRSNFLGQLGGQQIGQGSQLLGQSLNQFNQQGQMANMFGQAAQGNEAQGFQQMLQALMQNQSAGQQRLQNAQGLFGQGSDIFNQSFGQGLQGLSAQQGFNDQSLQAILGLRNAEANRIGATGQGSQALAEMQSGGGSGFGDFIGGLFSDRRLKENITEIGTLGPHTLYEWDWNDTAKLIGADKQESYGVIADEVALTHPELVSIDSDTGYMKVNYGGLV